MEPESSLPLLQAPATRPYPEPHQSRPCHHISEDDVIKYHLQWYKYTYIQGVPKVFGHRE